MQAGHARRLQDLETLGDAQLVALARQRDGEAFRVIMQRNNRRLYRVARAIVHDDAEAEDVVQQVYVGAFGKLGTFRGESSLATWLTRITVNEALARLRRQRPTVDLSALDTDQPNTSQVIPFPMMPAQADPEQTTARHQIRRIIEQAIDELPDIFRVVFVMREVEDMSVEETADFLNLHPATVKTRLHRARRLLRQALDAQLASTLNDTFPFDGARCRQTTDKVLALLKLCPAPTDT
jgi:RNA polymerase sigma-70 factor (ECF subfamily)